MLARSRAGPSDMKVCIDPGHGVKRGIYTGAASNGIHEDSWVLAFGQRLGHYLRKRGVKTVFTREGDGTVELKARARKARAEKCDLFLSLHLNAAASVAHGTEAFVTKGDFASKRVAQAIVEEVVRAGMKSRGVKWDSASQYSSLYVLRNTYNYMPAVLLEVGFLTNHIDARRLLDKRWMEDLACNLAAVIAPD